MKNRAFHTPLLYIIPFLPHPVSAYYVQPRSKSFWRQIDFGLDLSRCWVALWPAVLSGRGSGRVCLGAWGFPSASEGLPHPGFYSLREGWVYRPAPEARPNKGNADGAVGIFRKCQARVGYGPAPGPTEKKALCHTCP